MKMAHVRAAFTIQCLTVCSGKITEREPRVRAISPNNFSHAAALSLRLRSTRARQWTTSS
jgi:hypothetical protein